MDEKSINSAITKQGQINDVASGFEIMENPEKLTPFSLQILSMNLASKFDRLNGEKQSEDMKAFQAEFATLDWSAGTDQVKCQLLKEHLSTVLPIADTCPLNNIANCHWVNLKVGKEVHAAIQDKIVVLDFFTYCCINCMHVLPQLSRLENKYGIHLCVIGVHTAKFENEKILNNIDNAAKRYGIKHPVVNDANACLWQVLEIQCWPTLMVLGPNQEMLLTLSGENHEELISLFIDVCIQYYSELGLLKNENILTESDDIDLPSRALTQLRYPGKLHWSPSGSRLAISDTGNHRIIVTDRDGAVQLMIGSGQVGHTNGSYKTATFNSPQGVCWDPSERSVYVADTGNHAIRKVNLLKECVETLAGTSKQGNDLRGGDCDASRQLLSSPWDVLCWVDKGTQTTNGLLIAMAGTHQVWLMPFITFCWRSLIFEANKCYCIVGDGTEQNKNNTYPNKAAFAQPSGLTLGKSKLNGRGEYQDCLFVADSESSSIRIVSLVDGTVAGLVGGGRSPTDLFAFGDCDGKAVDARLQHPLGVAYCEENGIPVVYIADSYNHKIKRVEVDTRSCSTVSFITGLAEPGGLDICPQTHFLYVADTNNHQIKIVDMKDHQVLTLPVCFPLEDAQVDAKPAVLDQSDGVTTQTSGLKIKVIIEFHLRQGLHMNEDAPNQCTVSISKVDKYGKSGCFQERLNIKDLITTMDVMIDIAEGSPSPDSYVITTQYSLYCCDEKGFCMVKNDSVNVRYHVDTPTEDQVCNIHIHLE